MIENFNFRFCVLVLILQIFTFKPDDDTIILQGVDNAAGWDTSIRVWTKLLHWSGKNFGWKLKLSEEMIFFYNNLKIILRYYQCISLASYQNQKWQLK